LVQRSRKLISRFCHPLTKLGQILTKSRGWPNPVLKFGPANEFRLMAWLNPHPLWPGEIA
ncbi:MAG: hypothetical protein ACREC2_01395, partial [Bradyrhizobium sp.]